MSVIKENKNIKAITQKIIALKHQLQEEGKKAIDASFKEFFEQYPEVKSLSWTQYTPYFNDGDACYFSYNDLIWHPCILEIDGEEVEYQEPGDEDCEWWETIRGQAAYGDIEELGNLLSSLEDSLKGIFGDHAKVVATKDGFEIEEYYHD